MLFRRLALTTIAAALIAAPAAIAADKPLTKSDVEGIIKDYLMENPQVIMDSVRKFQEKQQVENQKNSKVLIKEKSKELFNDPKAPFAGNPKGDVVVVEFFDYHCGYCKKSLPTIAQLIEKDPKVKVVFHELPILSKDSEMAARAALAVFRIKPDKYFAYHTALMNSQDTFNEQNLVEIAESVGVSGDKLKKEMNGEEVSKELKKTADLARSLNISGTPAFIIGDTLIPGAVPYEQLKTLVDEARKAKK